MTTGEHPKRYLLGNSSMPNNPSASRSRRRHLPGVLVTSLNSSKSKSKVGGWCCRGQLDTAAVSCSNRMIQTSIRPGKQKVDPSEAQISRKNPLKISVSTAYEWQVALGWPSSLGVLALSAYERQRLVNMVWKTQNSSLTPHFKNGNIICKFDTEMTVRLLDILTKW